MGEIKIEFMDMACLNVSPFFTAEEDFIPAWVLRPV